MNDCFYLLALLVYTVKQDLINSYAYLGFDNRIIKYESELLQ